MGNLFTGKESTNLSLGLTSSMEEEKLNKSSPLQLASHSIYVDSKNFSLKADLRCQEAEIAGESVYIRIPPPSSSSPLPTKQQRMQAMQGSSRMLKSHDSGEPCTTPELINEIKKEWEGDSGQWDKKRYPQMKL